MKTSGTRSHAAVARELKDQLGIEKPVDLIVADVSSAIDLATDCDEREINYNCDFDWQAYADARKGLGELVGLTVFAKVDDVVSLVAAQYIYLASWATFILTYSIFVPNTWQRALAVLLPTAFLPYGLMFWLSWKVPGVESALEADKMGHSLPIPLLAVLVAVFLHEHIGLGFIDVKPEDLRA